MNGKDMLVNNFKRAELWASAMFLLGSAALQGAVGSCPQAPAADSPAWDFHAAATRTLGEIEKEASDLREIRWVAEPWRKRI